MEEEKDEYLPGYATQQEFSQKLFKGLVHCIQSTNGMLSYLEDYEFWCGFEEFQDFCSTRGPRITNRIGNLLHHHGVQCRWPGSGRKPLSSIDPEEYFDSIVEANDILMERVDSQLDEALGVSKTDKPFAAAAATQSKTMVSSWNVKKNEEGHSSKGKTLRLLTATNIQRPQLKWKDKIDNSNVPFVTILQVKPNALKPWNPVKRNYAGPLSALQEFIHQQRTGEENDIFENRNPYDYELDVFQPHEWQLEASDEIEPYKSLQDTPCQMITTKQELEEMCNYLKTVDQIAVDLEHHSYRSFLGFVCLMQISTRERDFIVDTLELREEMPIMNEVFTDPAILKVMHGSDSDINWFQRDFGVYVVNLFDTGQAARVLELERFSLAFLLRKYCNITLNKQYQLADWRIRPLPDEMVKYAREDTRYLLYVYDIMRNELIERDNDNDNLLRSVYSRSKMICSKVYLKPIYTADSYVVIYQKYKRNLNPQQLHCFKLIVAWRDKTSREEDESYGYTMPNHMMFHIAETLPRELQGVLACCNPIPPLVKQHVAEIYDLVKQSREFDPLQEKVIRRAEWRPVSTVRQVRQVRQQENQDENKVPEGSQQSQKSQRRQEVNIEGSIKTGFEIYPVLGPPVKIAKPTVTIFGNNDKRIIPLTEGEQKAHLILASFRSPFELFMPRTNNPKVAPSKILQNWKDISRQIKKGAIETEQAVSLKHSEQLTDVIIDSNSQQPAKTKKKKRSAEGDKTEQDESVSSLRDMLKKKKKRKKLIEIEKQESSSGTDSPISYEKTFKGASFVPFDYTKADTSKFKSAKKKHDDTKDTTVITEEPVRKGSTSGLKVQSKAGQKSMTYSNR